METIVDIDELNTLLSLEHGESMNLFVKRADDKLISNKPFKSTKFAKIPN